MLFSVFDSSCKSWEEFWGKENTFKNIGFLEEHRELVALLAEFMTFQVIPIVAVFVII